FAIWGVRALTFLLSNGHENFALHAELNWNVLGVTAALSVVCGLLFGLAPAIQSTRPDVMPALQNGRGGGPRRGAPHVLVVAQIALSFLILVADGRFVRTLNNLHSVQLRSEEHTSELQSRGHLVCRLLLEKKKKTKQ